MAMHAYAALGMAIVAEVIATSALKASAGFTRLWPSVVVVLGYGVAFYGLSLTLQTVPVGVAYAIWSGLGIVLVTVAGYLLYQQRVDLPALLGMALIVAGGAMIQQVSKTAAHRQRARQDHHPVHGNHHQRDTAARAYRGSGLPGAFRWRPLRRLSGDSSAH